MAANPIAQVIGKNIVQVAVQNGITLPHLASLLNVPPQTLRRWLTGERVITVYALVRVSRVLEVPLEQLVNGIE